MRTRRQQTHRCFCASAACQRIDPQKSKATSEDRRLAPDNGQVTAARTRDNAIVEQPRSPLDKTDNSRRNSPPPTFSDFLTRRNLPRIVLPAKTINQS